jgi:HEAT repeat protein
MRRTLLALPLLAACFLAAPARADDKEPELDGKTLSQWTALLRESENGRIRKAAVVSLGQIAIDHVNNSKAVKDIVVAVGKAMRNDASAGVRAEAARALERVAADLVKDRNADVASVVADLAEAIRVEKEADVRYEQAVALGRYGPQAKGAVTALATACVDTDPKVQAAAATALGRIGKDAKAALESLLPLVKSQDVEVRKAGIFAIGRIEPDDVSKASEAIAKFTTDADEQTRKEAVSSLCLLVDRTPDSVKAVAVALTDKSVEIRRLAAAGLAKFEREARQAEKELATAFKKDGEDKLVKAYALHSYCAGMKDDIPKIIAEFGPRLDPTVEKEAEVRLAVCDELGGLGPDGQAAVPALRGAQKDPVKDVREAAGFAISKIIAKKEDKKPEEKKEEKKDK